MHRDAILKEARDLAHVYRVTKGDTFRLQDIDPADTAGLEAEDKPRAQEGVQTGVPVLAALQDMLYAQDRWAVLLIFQGVDEWAGRRGQRYGTTLVNLEDHRGLDLLPERSAAAVAAWLAQHPTIQVVCRDRSALYGDGLRQGAPQALQVVDRFHLVKNLREATEAFLHNQRTILQAATARTAQALPQAIGVGPVTLMYRGRPPSVPTPSRQPTVQPQPRHLAWVTMYKAIHTLP